MKITPSIVIDAPTYYVSHFNGQYDTDMCLILRDLNLETDKDSAPIALSKIPMSVHVFDLTNNDLTQLPPLQDQQHIHTLLLSRNHISNLEGSLLPPNIYHLMLSNNGIDNFEQIEGLRNAPASLENLSLRGNNVCYLEDYRIHVLALLPHLKTLDFTKVSDEERSASYLKAAKSGIKAESVINSVVRDKDAEVMTHVVSKMDAEMKQELKDQLEKATTLTEMERIEKLLTGGV